MRENGHFYTQSGEPMHFVAKKDGSGNRPTTIADCRKNNWLPSPTTILKILAKPALVDWLIRNAVTAVVSDPDRPGEKLDDKITRVLDQEKQQDQESQAAMDLGASIHEAIELCISGQKWNESLSVYVNPVMRDLNVLGRVVASEKVLVNPIGYAGKTDCILENDDSVIVADFKTGKRIPDKPYEEHLLQCASYAGCLGNTGNKRIRGMLVYISTTTPGEIKVVECAEWEKDYRRFRLLLEFYKLTNNL